MPTRKKMTDREAAEICERIGHSPKGIHARPEVSKYRFECSCGYVTTYRATLVHALAGGVHHMHQVANEARSKEELGGLRVSLPDTVVPAR